MQQIFTALAPKAIGPYSQAIRTGNLCIAPAKHQLIHTVFTRTTDAV